MVDQIAVIGGGASGLMAAGRAAECGAPVVLLEKTRKLGAKLRITGRGRCNLSNETDLDEFVAHFGPNGRFLYRAFTRFFHQELRAFLAERGVPTVVERGRRVFPYSNKASHVVQALTSYVSDLHVGVRYEAPVKRPVTSGKRISGVQLMDGRVELYPMVILATGGASYPLTGSTGDGYGMAEALGHHIVPIRPALAPLVVEEEWVSGLQGLSLHNVRASLMVDGHVLAHEFGEMLFTHFGVSGPIILSLSKQAVEELGQGRVEISIDLKPALSDEQLDRRLRRELDSAGKKHYHNILKELVPLRMVDLLVAKTGIPPDKPGHQITGQERRRLLGQLRDLRMTVSSARPLDEAVITAGGVDLDQVDPRTMGSKLVEGLYFCGEVLDLDADTGGYNLQAAFSTGRLAGESAAEHWHRLHSQRDPGEEKPCST